jgi:hypothetical protein
MFVIARAGTKCPMEGNPRKYITDNQTVEVPDTAYYRRLVTDGSLITAKTSSTQRPDDSMTHRPDDSTTHRPDDSSTQ